MFPRTLFRERRDLGEADELSHSTRSRCRWPPPRSPRPRAGASFVRDVRQYPLDHAPRQGQRCTSGPIRTPISRSTPTRPGGGTRHFTLEMTSINMMSRGGWTSRTVKPGDVVTVIVAPLRDGRPGGLVLEVTLPNGARCCPACPTRRTTGARRDEAATVLLAAASLAALASPAAAAGRLHRLVGALSAAGRDGRSALCADAGPDSAAAQAPNGSPSGGPTKPRWRRERPRASRRATTTSSACPTACRR